MRKPVFFICENKDQRLCFRYTDSTIRLLSKSEISSLQPSSVDVQPGLCRTWSETPKTGSFVLLSGHFDYLSRIYVDVVINHMAGLGRKGTGTAGSNFDSDKRSFPGVPYSSSDFNKYCMLNSYNDPRMIRNCYLIGLTDLAQSHDYVRNKTAGFLNTLIDAGVAGFRVDAAKHMWPFDITAIQNKVKDLPEGGRPFFYHEVIDQNSGPIKVGDYFDNGRVTEFRYCQKIKQGIDSFSTLQSVVDFGWGMANSSYALVCVDNHDNQRGHEAGRIILTHKMPREYKMGTAFLLANDYGFTRVMSSYYFNQDGDGPPHNADFSAKDVTINVNGSCDNGWVCEHRWKPIANMVAFRNAVVGTTKQNWYQQGDKVAFSRGNKGFFAMVKNGHMNARLRTGLPSGSYCNLIDDCATRITVDGSGNAQIVINNNEEPIVAFITGKLYCK